MATLSSFVTGQSIAASIEKTYIKAPDSLFSSLWVASGAGIAVSTETGAANLPEGSNKTTALKILRASGSDYVRYRFKLDAADGGKNFKLFWNQIYSGTSGDYSITMLAFSDEAYTLNQTVLTLETSSVPSGTTSFYTTVPMPSYAVTPYIELRINGLAGTTPLYLSGIIVGPGNLMQGAVITDWQTYSTTLNAGFGGGTATGLRYRREGTDMIISGTFQSGAHTATPGTITLPSGLTIDFTKVASSNRGKLGRFEVINSGGGGLISSTDREGVLFTDGTSNTLIYFAIQVGTAAFTQNNPTSIASSNSYWTIDARIPISQWSGSGVTLIGPSAQVEYAYNTDITAASSPGGNGALASSTNGPTGVLISANWATGTNYIRRCNFQYPVQNDDVLVLEVADNSITPLVWVPIEERLCARLSTSAAFSYGAYISAVSGSTTAIEAVFLNGGYQSSATFGTAAGTAWSALSSFYWRIRKAKAVVPVGISASSSSGGGGSGFIISTKTLNFTAETLNHYLVDTSLNAITATLPAGSASASIKFSDDARTWSSQFFTIQPATGEKIDGLGINESLICDVAGSAVQISWDGNKWVLDTNAVGAGVIISNSSQLTEKNYIKRPDNTSSDWATSNAALVTFGTETTTANLPENVTKTSAIRITRVSGTTGYVYTRMILDSVDASKKLKLQWNQKYAGTSGDYTLQMFSFTASDYATGSTQLPVQTASIPAGNSTFSTTFDAPATTAPYIELRIVAAAGTTPIYLSGVIVGPGLLIQGAVVSEWQSYTPTLNGTTAVAATYPKGQYRRVGSSIEIALAVLYTGAGDNSFFTYTLPSGLSVNTAALTINNTLAIVGSGETRDGTSGARTEFSTGYNNGSLKLMLHGQNNYYNTSGTNNNFEINLRATIPVSEWSGSGTVNLINQNTQSPIRAGTIEAFAGTVTPAGWLDCDGTAYLQTLYPQLFAQIGSTWNTCTNPLTGVANVAPAAGSFRVPDLRSAFLRGVGGPNAAAVTTSLAGYQADQTAVNGLSVSVANSPNLNHQHFYTAYDYSYDGVTGRVGIAAGRSGTGNAGEGSTFVDLTHGHAGSSLSSTQNETRPDNVGVRYIIKVWDESFNLAGFAEATATSPGLSYKNRFQRKILGSNITSDGPISDFTFNNLIVGKVYRLDISARYVHVSSLDNQKIGNILITHTGTTIYGPYWNVNAHLGPDQYVQATSTFVATATTITMAVQLQFMQLWGPSYASITELNDTENTTAF